MQWEDTNTSVSSTHRTVSKRNQLPAEAPMLGSFTLLQMRMTGRSDVVGIVTNLGGTAHLRMTEINIHHVVSGRWAKFNRLVLLRGNGNAFPYVSEEQRELVDEP